MKGKKETKSYVVNKDEGPRAGTSKDFGRFKTCFLKLAEV
jgi:hypothetical protein